MARYINLDDYEESIENAIADLLVHLEFTPTTDVVPWAFLEKFAESFPGWRSHNDFVRMAKLFWEKEIINA